MVTGFPSAVRTTPETATVLEPAATAWNEMAANSPVPDAPLAPAGRLIGMSIRPAVASIFGANVVVRPPCCMNVPWFTDWALSTAGL